MNTKNNKMNRIQTNQMNNKTNKSFVSKCIKGFIILDLICMFIYSILLAFNIQILLGIDGPTSDLISFCLSGPLIIIMFFSYRHHPALGMTQDQSELENRIKNTNIDKEFYESQKEYFPPKEQGNKQFRILIILALALYIPTIVLLIFREYNRVMEISYPLYLDYIWNALFFYSFVFSLILICLFVLNMAGKQNTIWQRLYVFGFHIHESTFGILLILIGVPYIMTIGNVYTFQFFMGSGLIVTGVTLIGKDWKDVVKGDFVVHKSKEKDYSEYMKMKDIQNENNIKEKEIE
jgi:hypothetical protein